MHYSSCRKWIFFLLRMNGAIFISFYLKLFTLEELVLLSKGQQMYVLFNANTSIYSSHILYPFQCSLPKMQARVQLLIPTWKLNMSLLYLAPIGKKKKVCSSLSPLPSFFIWYGLHIYKSFIQEHSTWRRVSTLAVITLAGDTARYHMGSHFLSFCMTYTHS